MLSKNDLVQWSLVKRGALLCSTAVLLACGGGAKIPL